MQEQWTKDILGANWWKKDLVLNNGQVATLITHSTKKPKVSNSKKNAILYLHGYCDYFFQTHFAQIFIDSNIPFFAVDLRGYGRSMNKQGQVDTDLFYINDIALYAQELDLALENIINQGYVSVTLVAHSTGGLVGPLWVSKSVKAQIYVKKIILNSPWLDLNGNWIMKKPVTAIVGLIKKIAPKTIIQKKDGAIAKYGASIHSMMHGEWDFDLTLKPLTGANIRAGWIGSIRHYQKKLANEGFNIKCPIVVFTATNAVKSSETNKKVIKSGDIVLNPNDMWKLAHKLGNKKTNGKNVKVIKIKNAMHDIALSGKKPREEFFNQILKEL